MLMIVTMMLSDNDDVDIFNNDGDTEVSVQLVSQSVEQALRTWVRRNNNISNNDSSGHLI